MCSKEAIPSAWKEHHSSSLKMANCLMGCPPFPVEISPLAQTPALLITWPPLPAPTPAPAAACSPPHHRAPDATRATDTALLPRSPIVILMSKNQQYADSQI